jgi:very-short-patch-repair endonuclease
MQCGNSAQFQGDERDVMFLSMVDSSPADPPLTLRSEGYQGMYKKRFNVAASRARDQMWVVHSLDPSRDLKPDDLRYRLIKHAENPNSLVEEIERKTSMTESEFERQVVSRLIEAGFTVEPQWKVGAYRIDMVVGTRESRVAVECDGDRWHPPEKSADDMARQALLERLGWRRFIRLRGSEYFRNPDEAIRRLIERLRALGVQPDRRPENSPPNQPGDELRERVIRRAAELLREWRELGVDQNQARPKQQWGRKSGNETAPQSAVPDVNGPPVSDQASTVEHTVPQDSTAEKLPVFGGNETTSVSNGRPADPVILFTSMGCEVIDKRPLGGNLWILGGNELDAAMSELAARGIKFSFKPEGGKATGHRAAWFTS